MERKAYLEHLVKRCRKPPDYLSQIDAPDGPLIGIIGFDHYPFAGQYTYFSHGLHKLNRPEWKAGRPEYFITIDHSDRGFAVFFAYVISAFAFEKSMTWNTLIGVGEKDAVDGYPYRRIALGPPGYLEWPSYQIEESGELPINLGMAYFMSDADFVEAARTGIGYLQLKINEDQDYWRKIRKR